MAGATLEGQLGSAPMDQSGSLLTKVMDTLIPPAQAQVLNVCDAFTDNGSDDYSHCITLTIPDGDMPTTVDVDLDGPTVYHYYSCQGGQPDFTYYYSYADNFSGTANGVALTPDGNDFAFTTTINGLQINGLIDGNLENATGELVNQTGMTIRTGQYGAQDFCSSDTSYGAFWEADLAGAGTCSPGSGVSTSNSVGVDDGVCAQ